MKKLKQSGVALITVMLILSLATVTAVSMVSKQNIDIHRSANILNFDQAIEMSVLIENYAKRALADHFFKFKNSTITSFQLEFSNGLTAGGISVDEISGWGNGKVEDVQARFNLNSLVTSRRTSPVTSGSTVVPLQRARLITLITNLNDDENLDLNINFVDALIDWIDFDPNVNGINGAEDAVYTSLKVPYTTANQYLNDISELLLVSGMDYDSYKILKKYVCVLQNPLAAMNINTAEPQVLRSLDSTMTLPNAVALYNSARNINSKKGFARVGDFIADPSNAGLTIDPAGLDVTSNNYDLQTEVRRNDTVLLYTSRINLDSGKFVVVKRSRSLLL